VRVTRLNVAGEIAVAIVVYAVLIYELAYSELGPRIAALVVLGAGVVLCQLTIHWLRDHPRDLGKVQLVVALAIGSSFVFADRLPRTAFLLLCALVAGFLSTALYGLRSSLRAQRGS
jgi:hypothetical protein